MLTRLFALIIKELLAVLRDNKSRFILIAPPIIQLMIFSYAATLDVKNVDIMILNRDGGHWSQELIQRIDGAPTFRSILRADRSDDIRDAINEQKVIAALQIGPDFSRNIESRSPADVEIILDGRRSNAAQIVANGLQQIIADLATTTPIGLRTPGLEVIARNWFNPALNFQWFMVPSLIAVIAVLIGLIITGLSIARERELGTFDQLMVSPLRTHEILIGKLIPPMLIGLFHITVYILAAVLIFKVPLRGSLIYLYGSSVIFLAAVAGVGLLISALCATQQQAILGAFLFMVPAQLLSGFATPIENMPIWLQQVTIINPLRYFLIIVKGVFLRDIPFEEVFANSYPLALIAVVSLTTAAWMFRRRME